MQRRFALLTTAAVLVLTLPALAADPAPLTLEKKIPSKGRAGNLDHLALDVKNGRLFIANKANDTLDIVDLKAGKLIKQISGQSGVQGLAYAPDLDRIYAALGTGGFLNIFDGKNYELIKTIKFADDADNVRYDAKSQRVYVAHAENALAVVDAKTFRARDIKLPAGAESFQLEAGRPRLYVNCPATSEVILIDTATSKIVKHFPVKLAQKNFPMAIDEANHRLFIGCRKEPMVIVMDSETGKEITSVPITGDTDDLHFDAKRKRLYASCGAGELVIIRQVDADHYQPLTKIPTAKGARTCLWSPDADSLYLAVPRQTGKEGPEIWVYKVK